MLRASRGSLVLARCFSKGRGTKTQHFAPDDADVIDPDQDDPLGRIWGQEEEQSLMDEQEYMEGVTQEERFVDIKEPRDEQEFFKRFFAEKPLSREDYEKLDDNQKRKLGWMAGATKMEANPDAQAPPEPLTKREQQEREQKRLREQHAANVSALRAQQTEVIKGDDGAMRVGSVRVPRHLHRWIDDPYGAHTPRMRRKKEAEEALALFYEENGKYVRSRKRSTLVRDELTGQTVRQKRVSKLAHERLQAALDKMGTFDAVANCIAVEDVQVTACMRHAKVLWSATDPKKIPEAQRFLTRNYKRIRYETTQRLNLKYSLRLRFVLDKEANQNLHSLLDSLAEQKM